MRFCYDSSPSYDGQLLPQWPLRLRTPQGRLIASLSHDSHSARRCVVHVETLVIRHDTATVKVAVPTENVYGTFVLRKAGQWVIISFAIYQT